VPRVNTEESFWASCYKDPSGCWLWTKNKSPKGYGKTYWKNKDMRAHRLAFFFKNNYMPETVCHKCDNPSCINPDHLFAGTHKLNMMDMKLKGRAARPKGVLHPMRKYSVEQIKEVRRLHSLNISLNEISKSVLIPKSYVRQIVLKQRWGHL
jgi:HNH endonuclease